MLHHPVTSTKLINSKGSTTEKDRLVQTGVLFCLALNNSHPIDVTAVIEVVPIDEPEVTNDVIYDLAVYGNCVHWKRFIKTSDSEERKRLKRRQKRMEEPKKERRAVSTSKEKEEKPLKMTDKVSSPQQQQSITESDRFSKSYYLQDHINRHFLSREIDESVNGAAVATKPIEDVHNELYQIYRQLEKEKAMTLRLSKGREFSNT